MQMHFYHGTECAHQQFPHQLMLLYLLLKAGFGPLHPLLPPCATDRARVSTESHLLYP